MGLHNALVQYINKLRFCRKVVHGNIRPRTWLIQQGKYISLSVPHMDPSTGDQCSLCVSSIYIYISTMPQNMINFNGQVTCTNRQGKLIRAPCFTIEPEQRLRYKNYFNFIGSSVQFAGILWIELSDPEESRENQIVCITKNTKIQLMEFFRLFWG